MSWFDKFIPTSIKLKSLSKKEIPQGLWEKCPSCQHVLYKAELDQAYKVCPHCQYHFNLTPLERFKHLFDEIEEDIGEEVESTDRLNFKDTKRYKDRLLEAKRGTTSSEALVVKRGWMGDQQLVIAAFDFNFIGGSMGTVVGERFILAINKCLELKIPLVCIAASGGARMQESLYSLMQMTKTSAGIGLLGQAHLPYIVVMTSPCMGGVSASLATLGDILIAEPNALVGFTGPKVIEQTVRESLPEGFQRSEFLLEKGAIDMIVSRQELKSTLIRILGHLMKRRESV